MCEHLSWLKHDGKILFLTDADVESSHGKDVLSFKDDDVVGHSAILAYYGIPAEVGEQGECKDIWNPKKFPEPIRSMLSDYDKHWGVTFRKYLTTSDLCYIITYASEAWKEKARKELKRREQ